LSWTAKNQNEFADILVHERALADADSFVSGFVPEFL
jgi:hypothetical protein